MALGFIATISALTGLLNNGLCIFYLKKKLPMNQTAFDLVVADILIITSFSTASTYFCLVIGLMTTPIPIHFTIIVCGMHQILFMGFYSCVLVILVLKILYLEHGVILFNTPDSTIRKLSWISIVFLTLANILMNNFGPKQASPYLFTFVAKDESFQR